MKTKLIGIFILILAAASCGKKSIVETASFESIKALTDNNQIAAKDDVDEHTCIDAKLTKDLDSGESIKKMVSNTDITFCNGVRLRLKTYQFASKKYKAYGYVKSNSGNESCLIESDDFTLSSILGFSRGDQGVLNGNGIKILVGGHQFDSDNKVVPSEHKLARHVKFEWGSYSGELAISEKGKVRCWAIQ